MCTSYMSLNNVSSVSYIRILYGLSNISNILKVPLGNAVQFVLVLCQTFWMCMYLMILYSAVHCSQLHKVVNSTMQPD